MVDRVLLSGNCMARVSFIKDVLSEPGVLPLYLRHRYQEIVELLYSKLVSDKVFLNRLFKRHFQREVDFSHPRTLNEKIQWLKINDRKDFHTVCADKYAVRKYIGDTFGQEYLVPLLFSTSDHRDLTPGNLPDCDCIIKANNGCGGHTIVRDNNRDSLDFPRLREEFRHALKTNYYYRTREWQYKNIPPRIIIEKLLETRDGKIPNDYKFHYINGELQFIYVSYDREGVNDRCIYDGDWNRLPFIWIGRESYRDSINRTDVPRPATLEKMKEFGAIVARNFKLVRVDFYDVDGVLYFGEITLHHGSGRDHFFPEEYDVIFGDKLKLD